MNRKKYFALLLVCLMVPIVSMAQNEAFFYNNYNELDRDGNAVFAFENFSSGNGMGFNNFNDNFNGFGFDDFSNNGGGFSIGNFELTSDVPIGNGLLVLSAMALVYKKRKSKK